MNETVNYRFPGLKLLVGLASLVIVAAGLRASESVLIPFLFALFLATLGTPPVRYLKRKGVPKILSVLTVAIVIIALLVFVGSLLGQSANEFTRALPRYQNRLMDIYAQGLTWLSNKGLQVSANRLNEIISPGAFLDFFGSTLRGLVGAVSSTVMVIIVMVFMLYEAADFRAKLKVAMGEAFLESRFQSIAFDVQRYLGIKTVTSAVTGALVGSFTYLMGIEFWVLWMLTAFLLNFIPFVGSIIASIPAVALALIQFGTGAAVWTALAYVIINVGVSNFLEPVLMGRRLGLSPLVVFLSLVFWGFIWGPAGMLLSVPLSMVLKILLEHSEEFRWMALLMDNRPATSGEERLSREGAAPR